MSLNYINNFIEKIDDVFLRNEFNKSGLQKKHKSLGKKISEREISQKDYNIIIEKFHDIYYNELYFINKPSYFFLGGFLEKKRTKPGVRVFGNVAKKETLKRYVEFPISISWTDVYFLKQKRREISYKKMKGVRSRTGKIEKIWKQNNNFYDLKEV